MATLINLTDDTTALNYYQRPENFVSENFGNQVINEGDTFVIQKPPFYIPYTNISIGTLDIYDYVWTAWTDSPTLPDINGDQSITPRQTIYLDNQIPLTELDTQAIGLVKVHSDKQVIEPIREGDVFTINFGTTRYTKRVIDLYGVINATTNNYTYDWNDLISPFQFQNLPINTIVLNLGTYYIESNPTATTTILRCLKPFQYQTTII